MFWNLFATKATPKPVASDDHDDHDDLLTGDPLARFSPHMLDDLPLRPCGVFAGYRKTRSTAARCEANRESLR
ncbi:hypothetical protein COO20_17510 [Thalassospira marina]|uniref:Uncharacterized protein n=1 Tax=Thalassospira marina TaxID=2048283 RepID=A0A2N3KMZ3_9PROT|nr:hypothetical protein COO20_17510 [Thalassospira marina]